MNPDLTKLSERNSLLLREAMQLYPFTQGKLIGESERDNPTGFYSLGSFYSKTLSETIWAGIKKYADHRELLRSLRNILYLDKYCPELSKAMPRFMGVLYVENNPESIIMEDYSQGGNRRVHCLRVEQKDIFPQSLLDMVTEEDGRVDLEELIHLYGDVSEKLSSTDGLKIMDVNSIHWNKANRLKVANFKAQLMQDTASLNQHCLFLREKIE
ncbi:hypothetical protein HYZ97_00485 [Candidatus Pacearchaeota archaeon]|nr:hypothetical protein [Candidatus Pacearchaeota archaeon]